MRNKTEFCKFYRVLQVFKNGLTQNDSDKLTQKTQIGLSVKVDFNSNTETVTYNNSNGQKVYIVNPFANIKYGEDIIIDLDTKVFNKIA